MSPKEKKEGTFTPTEVAEIVNENLMSKPNKGIVFSSFINKVDHASFFIQHCIKNLDTPVTLLYQIINDCDTRINELKDGEIKKLEDEIAERQKRLEELKRKK